MALALLLNRVTLQPGEALFLGPGLLHSYLGGTGVEVMASSDNVIRAGLTSKPTDIRTFLEVVSTDPTTPEVQRPAAAGGVADYRAPVSEFSLQRIEIEADGEVAVAGGPAILLCARGRTRVDGRAVKSLEIKGGGAVWVDAGTERVTLRGEAAVFRVGIGSGP